MADACFLCGDASGPTNACPGCDRHFCLLDSYGPTHLCRRCASEKGICEVFTHQPVIESFWYPSVVKKCNSCHADIVPQISVSCSICENKTCKRCVSRCFYGYELVCLQCKMDKHMCYFHRVRTDSALGKVEPILQFVKDKTSKYDEGHGLDHALRVYENAQTILTHTPHMTDEMYVVVAVASLVHDVGDAKFDKYGQDRRDLESFLRSAFSTRISNFILHVVDNISFSKEKRGELDARVLAHDSLSMMRHIVSDADKLDALGKNGLIRVYQCARFKHPNASPKQIHELVVEHAIDKLFLLKDHYIRTPIGKKLAEPLHQYMYKELWG